MNKIKPHLSLYLKLLIYGSLQRLAILLFFAKRINSLIDFFTSFFVGIIFDSVVVGTLLLCFILIGFISTNKLLSKVLVFTIALLPIANAIDLISLKYTHLRAGAHTFNIINVDDLIRHTELSFVFIFCVASICVFLLALYRYRFIFSVISEKISIKSRLYLIFILTSSSLLYLPFPINYYADQISINKEFNQISLNPFYNYGTAMINSNDDVYMNPKEAISQFYKYNRGLEKRDKVYRPVNYSKLKSFKRVVLIVMESFNASRIGVLGGLNDLSPYFDTLSKEGKLYTRCFSCGPRTQYAISSLLYGFPHILRYNLFRQNKQKLPFQGLISLLNRNKYSCHFLHGGYADYDDMDLLLQANDSINIRDADSISNYKFINKWGVDDESFFDDATNYISNHSNKQFYCMLSMSNHGPWQLPSDFVIQPKYKDLVPGEKTFLYSDYALGKFIKQLKQKKLFDESLIIITGDHGESYSYEDNETKIFHVPLLIIDHENTGLDNSICSHADVAEFILSKTNFVGNSHLMGKSLMSKFHSAYYSSYENETYKVTDSCVYKYNLKSKKMFSLKCQPTMYVNTIDAIDVRGELYKLVQKDILSYYEVNRYLFENGIYHSYN